MKRNPNEVLHLYITEQPIKHGGMTTGADKSSPFVRLCVVDPFAEGYPSEHKARRDTLALRHHWHGPGKPACERCQLLQVVLKANVRKREDRVSYTRFEFQKLLRETEAASAP